MTAVFEMDDSSFPLVIAAFRGPVQIHLWDAYVARLDGFCKERRRFCLIIDMSQGQVPSASERKHIADGIAERRVVLSRYCAGSSVVVTNPLVRGAMTAIFWIQPLPFPHEIVSAMDAARSFCAVWLTAGPPSRRIP